MLNKLRMSLNIRFLVHFLVFLLKNLVVFARNEISRITAIITRIKAIIVENRRNIPIKINGVRIEIQSLLDRDIRTFRLRNIKIAIPNPM